MNGTDHLPKLTTQERRRNLELGMEARRRYAAIKARVKSGELTFAQAMDEEDAKRIPVLSLLRCVPGVGDSKSEKVMRHAGIAGNRRVGGLGKRQREILKSIEKDGWKTEKG